MELKEATKDPILKPVAEMLIKKIRQRGHFAISEKDLILISRNPAAAGNFIFRLIQKLAVVTPGERKLRAPKTPWQHFKYFYFPDWLKKKFPPKFMIFDAMVILPDLWKEAGYPKDFLEKNVHRFTFFPIGEGPWSKNDDIKKEV